MKYFSELTGEIFDTVDELKTAEEEINRINAEKERASEEIDAAYKKAVQAWEDYPAIQSPEFYIPANINATINSSGTIYAREVWPITYDCELTMYLENEKLTSRKVSNTSGVDYSFTINDKTLTNSSKKVRFSTDGRTRLSGYAYVRNVSVTYR